MTDNQRKEAVEFGRGFMEGALVTLGKYFIIGLFISGVVTMISDHFRWRFDGTDNVETGQRSGMKLRTDYGTGCQYLETRDGSLSPRLGADGKQFCR